MELKVTRTEERQNSVLVIDEGIEMNVMSVKENGALVTVTADINAQNEEGSPAYLGSLQWNRGTMSAGGIILDADAVVYVQKFKEVVDYLGKNGEGEL